MTICIVFTTKFQCMHKLKFFPLGNADTSLIKLDNGKTILIDFDDRANSVNEFDLTDYLDDEVSDSYDVVCFTHLDTDHIHGFSDYFYLDHTPKYQSDKRKVIKELWVPAAVILETGLTGEQAVLRAEARYRLKEGKNIKVFSKPDKLKDWCKENDIDFDSVSHLFVGAGEVVTSFNLTNDGVELFVHSPFSTTVDEQELDRNNAAIVLHATFNNLYSTKILFGADVDFEIWKDIINISKYYKQSERLEWDLIHVSHHCSYKALSDEKGSDKTTPIDEVVELFETYGNNSGFIVSPSQEIPDEDTIQPPHRQAAQYYEDVASMKNGQFLVTMEEPNSQDPQPLIFKIDSTSGIKLEKSIASSATYIGTTRPPRNG